MAPKKRKNRAALHSSSDSENSEGKAEPSRRETSASQPSGQPCREASEDEEHPVSVQRSPKRRRQSGHGTAMSSTLLNACKQKGREQGDLSSTAAAWVDRYKADQPEGIAELLTLIVQAGGSAYTVAGDEVEEGEVDRLVSAVRAEVDQEGYIDLFKSKAHKHFPSAFMELWESLIQKCADQEVLYDHMLLERVCHLLTGLSSSDVRCLRYVGTLTAHQVATGLVRVILALSDGRERADRQHAAESKKKNKTAQERAEAFQRTSQRFHSHINELEAHINSLFQGITTIRFRDVDEEIREIVIDGIGNWVQLYPAGYLKDLYLKYIAWALSDRAAGVREAAVEAIIGMLEEPDNLTPLAELISRFNQRFIELPDDVHDSVAIKGVQLLTLLVKLEALPQSEVTGVYQLLLEEGGAIRDAAAELVSVLIEDSGKRHALKQAGQRGRRKSLDSLSTEELQLAGILHIVEHLRPETADATEQSAVSASLAAKVVDALFGRVKVLEDWAALSEALLDDKACEKRGEAATTDAALLLQAAAQRACGVEIGLSSTARRKVLRVKAAAAIEEHRHRLTMVMSRTLLKLLRKFQADAVKAAALASIVQHLKLEIFSLKKDEQGLGDILRAIVSLLTKHAVPDTAQACMQALAHCADPEGAGPQEPGHGILVELAAALVEKLACAVRELLALSEEELAAEAAAERGAECEEVFNCRTALLRTRQLLLVSPAACRSASLAHSLGSLLKAGLEGSLPAWLLEDAIKCRALLLAWQLQQQLEGAGGNFEGWPAAAGEFVRDLHLLLKKEGSPRAAVVFCMADMFNIFRPENTEGRGAPVLHASAEQVDAMWAAVEEVLAAVEVGAGGPGSAASSQTGAAVVASLGRLVVHKIAPFVGLLPGRILSCLAGEEAVGAVAREVHQHVKKANPEGMPQVYSEALECLYKRTKGGHSSDVELLELCRKIANFHTPFVADAGEALAKIVEGGIAFAFKENVPEDVPFVGVFQALVPRLPARAADKIAALLDAAAEGRSPDPVQAEWEAFCNLRNAVKERSAKLNAPRSALRKAGAGGTRQGRRISFKEAGKRQRVRRPRLQRAGEEEASDDEVLEAGGESAAEEPSPGAASKFEQVGAAEPRRPSARFPAPRFHNKTRRGSQALTPPDVPAERAQDTDTVDTQDEEDGGSLPDVPHTAEEMPSGLFMAGTDSGVGASQEWSKGVPSRSFAEPSSPGAAALEEEDAVEDDDEEDEMPRIRPRTG